TARAESRREPSSWCRHASRVGHRRPDNSAEQLLQVDGMPRLELRDPTDATPEMRLEVGQASPVLRFGSVANTVGENRLESLPLSPRHVNPVVHHGSGEHLSAAPPHDARLRASNGVALLASDLLDKADESRDAW